MRVLLIRILCNLIMSVVSISIIVTKICQFSFSIIYLLWGVPIIFINLLDIIFSCKKLSKKPEKVDIRFSTLLISLGAALALVFTSFFLNILVCRYQINIFQGICKHIKPFDLSNNCMGIIMFKILPYCYSGSA